MDCGPAALKCVLEGFGVNVSYARLREACRTSVHGTSVDTLEEVAASLDLEATQLMMPVEHVVAARARTLPAIAVVRMPSGLTHFVVLWRRLGPYLQIMDPARGRRWVRAAAFSRDLHVHTQPIEVAAFRELVADPTFAAILARLAAKPNAAAEDHACVTRADAGSGRRRRVLLRGAVLIHLARRAPRT